MYSAILLLLTFALTSSLAQQTLLDCSNDEGYDSSCNGYVVSKTSCDLSVMVTMDYGKTYACLEVFLKKYATCPGGVFTSCGDSGCKEKKNVIHWRQTAYYYCVDRSDTCPEELALKQGSSSYYYQCEASACQQAKFGLKWQYSQNRWICAGASKTCKNIKQDPTEIYYCQAASESNCSTNYLIPSQNCQEESCYEEYSGWSCRQKETENSVLLIAIAAIAILVVSCAIFKIHQKKKLEKALGIASGFSDSYLIKN